MAGNCDRVPIKVLCRVRPLNPAEYHTQFLPVLYDDEISLTLSGRQFTFDNVFGPESTQEEVYNDGVSAIVDDVLSGYNGTIFAYGQTASGKTHTMEGCLDANKASSQRGITPRIVVDIFRHIDELPVHIEASLKVSYFEVYMDKIKDLLDVSKVNLPVHEDKNKIPYVKGVTEVDVQSLDEVFHILDVGKANRSVAVTNMNEHSSRSHSVFVLQVRQADTQSEKTLYGKLYLVDLAGSEKVNKTGAAGITLKEAKKINKSLSALGNVISALADGNKNHVPYRDSKLTRILQQSLGGNSRTSIFVCCSPSSSNESETRSSLMFGQRAKTIKNEIRVNEELTAEEWKRRFDKEREKNAKLRSKLAQYELGAVPSITGVSSVKDNSPDVIPQISTSLTCVKSLSGSALTSHMSMPCLLPISVPELSDSCQECLRYQQDISKLCQQLDEKDDELGERSREILELESRLRDLNLESHTMTQNNTLIVSEYKDMEQKYSDTQEEVKAILTALEELADSFQDKNSEVLRKTRENEELNMRISQLEEEVMRSKDELSRVQVSLNQSQKQTVDMFLDIFNDFSQAGSADKSRLRPSSLYESSPNLNLMTSSYSSSLGSSMSAHSGLSRHCDSDMSRSVSGLTNSSSSMLDLSSPMSPTDPEANIMTHSMYCPRTTTESITSPEYQGSRMFQERVGEMKGRLATLLENNFDRIMLPPDTTSSYIRNVKLRKMKPRTGGRVFSVFSRATRRQANHSSDNILPMHIGKRD